MAVVDLNQSVSIDRGIGVLTELVKLQNGNFADTIYEHSGFLIAIE
jgi:hypothetical protein